MGVEPAGRFLTSPVGVKGQVVFEQIHKLPVVRHVPLPLQNLPQPYQLFLLLALHLSAVGSLLVFPVRRNAVLRRLVHLKSADLDFKGLPVAAD